MDSPRLSTTPVAILAGGLGTRLRSVLPQCPKALAPIGSRPFLEIQIELLRDQGARQFVLCVGHLAEQIKQHFGDGSRCGVRIDYSVESDRLLGTGGALKLAEHFLAPRALVLNGDTFFALDYEQLLTRHEQERTRCDALATLALAHATDTGRYGNVRLDPSGRYLVGFREKADGVEGDHGWLSAGAYVIESELPHGLAAGEPYSLEREVFPHVLAIGRPLAALTSGEPFFDIGTPDGLAAFTDYYAAWHEQRVGTPGTKAAGAERRILRMEPAQPRAAYFLDRDGVVIEEVHYLSDPAQVRLLPGSAEAIARLNRQGIPVVVVTNQAGVAHGYFPESRVAKVHDRLDALLAAQGAFVDRYYYCPHHPTASMARYRATCQCRKPRPGLLLQAAEDMGLDLGRSVMIGDKLTDIEAGRSAGCRVILVRTGYGAEAIQSAGGLGLRPENFAADLADAVKKSLPQVLTSVRAA